MQLHFSAGKSPVAHTVKHGTSDSMGMDLIPRGMQLIETYAYKQECNAIKASAKHANVQKITPKRSAGNIHSLKTKMHVCWPTQTQAHTNTHTLTA